MASLLLKGDSYHRQLSDPGRHYTVTIGDTFLKSWSASPKPVGKRRSAHLRAHH
jgi:hypothetical protein